MDYTKFLGKKEHVVLAYLGGPYVFGENRRLRVEGERPAHGFHRFEVSGRNARSLEAAEPPDFTKTKLPKARGHFVAGWLATQSGLVRLSLLPEEEPAPFAIVRARRWHSGDWIFESLDFDGEAEEAARLRLERGEGLSDLKGVAATLRMSYGIALATLTARQLGTEISPREVSAHAAPIAEGGRDVAVRILQGIAAERLAGAERARLRVEAARARDEREQARTSPTRENAALRAEAALEAAEARMLASRVLGHGQLEVTWQFMDERFISVVDAMTLHVYDSGVCLAGEDELVTLDSLPGVIREAIETGSLVITRH
ncbi:MAG: hypothetical protein JST00_29300 [Deltaproteobacteria bacterium]|nr:hypothetical protein [Deltaproteobacteria bacterium]